jgi:hypothetical protein
MKKNINLKQQHLESLFLLVQQLTNKVHGDQNGFFQHALIMKKIRQTQIRKKQKDKVFRMKTKENEQ